MTSEADRNAQEMTGPASTPDGGPTHAASTPHPRGWSAWPLETWLYVLLAVAIATTSVVAYWSFLSVRSLRDSVTQTGLTQSAIQQFEAVGLTRNAIDGDVLTAAAGTPKQRIDAAKRASTAATTIGQRFQAVHTQLVAAGTPPALIAKIDAAGRSLVTYSNTASEVTADLSINPTQAPVALKSLTTDSNEVYVTLGSVTSAVTAYDQATNAAARSTADAGFQRVLVVSVSGIVVLIALAVVIWRRIRSGKAESHRVQEAEALAAAQLQQEFERQRFASQLRGGLEMAPDEAAALSIGAQALEELKLPGPAEILIANSTRAPFRRAVATGSAAEGCGVETPWECPAIRSGTVEVFVDGTALDACPRLRGIRDGDCAAVCTPLMFGGRGIGVIHASGPRTPPFSMREIDMTRLVGSDLAMRIGTLRVLERTSHEANYDALTGLLTRRALDARLGELDHDGRAYSVAMADLDHFKQLNDSYGHEEGDRALRAFGTAALSTVRPEDFVGRYGGEEFVFVYPDTNLDQARIAVERLRSTVKRTVGAGASHEFTLSAGLAEYSPGMSADEVVRLADERLLKAKALGRDRVVAGDADLGPGAPGGAGDGVGGPGPPAQSVASARPT